MELLLFFFGRCLSAVRSKRVHSRPGAVPAQSFHLFQMELVSLFDLAPLFGFGSCGGGSLGFLSFRNRLDVCLGFIGFTAAGADCSQQDSGDKGGEDHGFLHGSSFLLRNLDYKRVCPFIRLDGQTGKGIYAF